MKHVIITGASRGIGKAIAVRFAQASHTIAICARTQSDLENARSDILAAGPDANIIIKSCDMANTDDVDTFAQFVLSQWPTVDVLVNNAGVFLPGSVYNEPAGNLEKLIATNLYSAYHLTRAVVPAMIEKGKGHIINISSVAGIKPYANGGSYSISKYALQGFSENLREDLKPLGIRVTGVLPGATLTDAWAGFEGKADRLMPADDIANAVFYATELSSRTVVENIVLRPQLGDL